jgi:hypothetical protein
MPDSIVPIAFAALPVLDLRSRYRGRPLQLFAMARGLPGRVTIRERPRTPAPCRDRMAVGTSDDEAARIASPNPGKSKSITAAIPSGVRSRGAGQVPPLTIIKLAAQPSARSHSAAATLLAPSGMMRAGDLDRGRDRGAQPFLGRGAAAVGVDTRTGAVRDGQDRDARHLRHRRRPPAAPSPRRRQGRMAALRPTPPRTAGTLAGSARSLLPVSAGPAQRPRQ